MKGTDYYLDFEAGKSGPEPVWVVKLHPIECGCDGGIVERITGESQGMGGIEPVTTEYHCDETGCVEGLLSCVECGDVPAFEMPSFDRLCATHMKEAAAEVGAYPEIAS